MYYPPHEHEKTKESEVGFMKDMLSRIMNNV